MNFIKYNPLQVPNHVGSVVQHRSEQFVSSDHLSCSFEMFFLPLRFLAPKHMSTTNQKEVINAVAYFVINKPLELRTMREICTFHLQIFWRHSAKKWNLISSLQRKYSVVSFLHMQHSPIARYSPKNLTTLVFYKEYLRIDRHLFIPQAPQT